ncbi:unnamed protein product [Pseudo-nitzschia multistriata]|uniref:Nucleoporin NSP1-like C-terminal domain-containing protein n=1 Tax=Pseudo-nitzschia multistriata TaxID=183589 RepID=A0A448ZPY8_9STRA|nr:unnamed protein product [Pseudo-nitzschia multistriata]
MPYSSLPQDQKNNIDTVYQAIMNHKRTILAVSSMAPRLLNTSTEPADVAGGGEEVPLSITVKRLTGNAQQLEQELRSLWGSMMHTKQMYETSTTQAIRDAKWPTEFVATRVGATLTGNSQQKSSNERGAQAAASASSTKDDTKKAEDFNRRLKELLDREMVHADQIYRMPSSYLWQCVEEMEGRARQLQGQLQSLQETLEISNQVSSEQFDVVGVIQLQEQTIWKVAADLTEVHNKVDELRHLYNLHEKGINVLEEARQEEIRHQQQVNQQMRTLMVKTLPTTAPAAGGPAPAASGGLFGSTTPTASAGGGLFGKSPAPASGGLFGAPAPSTGGLFGSAPAPAPGGLFGKSPAPAPGGLFGAPAPAPAFGAAPAPAPGGLFGSSTPAPAPAAGGLFGSTTPAPAPAAGGLFGSTPAPAPAFGAPAPAAGGLFGAPAPAAPAFGAPAPAAGGLFGSAPASATTPKSKSRSRGSSRRR